MRPTARTLPDGERVHLHHGPSDLIIWAEGDRDRAYAAAIKRFDTVIGELVEELPNLRNMLSPFSRSPRGVVARRMFDASMACASFCQVTPMAAVAGAIADEVLAAMLAAAKLQRAYVNNGGDIALYLAPGTSFTTAMHGYAGQDLGRIQVRSTDGIGGIATSGRHGRSLSLGIADSVTILAKTAAAADVAATLVANAVDLPGHSAITRRPAHELDDTTDLGGLPVVVACRRLTGNETGSALANGSTRAGLFRSRGLIDSACLFLHDQFTTVGAPHYSLKKEIQDVKV